MTVGEFINQFKLFGLQAFKRYYSIYPGTVFNNNDPEKLMRVRIKCPAVYGSKSPDIWAIPRGIRNGEYNPPEINENIWISFLEGDPKAPVWEHGYYQTGSQIANAAATSFIKRTPSGLELIFDDLAKTITINHIDNLFTIEIASDGISIKNEEGNSLKESLDSMNEGITKIQVPTAFGTSGFPINSLTFQEILLDIEKYLK